MSCQPTSVTKFRSGHVLADLLRYPIHEHCYDCSSIDRRRYERVRLCLFDIIQNDMVSILPVWPYVVHNHQLNRLAYLPSSLTNLPHKVHQPKRLIHVGHGHDPLDIYSTQYRQFILDWRGSLDPVGRFKVSIQVQRKPQKRSSPIKSRLFLSCCLTNCSWPTSCQQPSPSIPKQECEIKRVDYAALLSTTFLLGGIGAAGITLLRSIHQGGNTQCPDPNIAIGSCS